MLLDWDKKGDWLVLTHRPTTKNPPAMLWQRYASSFQLLDSSGVGLGICLNIACPLAYPVSLYNNLWRQVKRLLKF
jgi:hypothetical protein